MQFPYLLHPDNGYWLISPPNLCWFVNWLHSPLLLIGLPPLQWDFEALLSSIGGMHFTEWISESRLALRLAWANKMWQKQHRTNSESRSHKPLHPLFFSLFLSLTHTHTLSLSLSLSCYRQPNEPAGIMKDKWPNCRQYLANSQPNSRSKATSLPCGWSWMHEEGRTAQLSLTKFADP